MGKHDERIDVYIAGAAEFARPILEHLRAIVHQACPDVEETMKWSFPHFQYKGMLCSMAAFKEHCAFGFWKGSLILGKGKGESQGEGATARNGQEKVGMGHLGRITKIADLPPKKIMSGNIKEAMRLNDEGVKARPGQAQAQRPVDVPDDLAAALDANTQARCTFEKFPPSHKASTIDWINEAKTAATRTRRLAQAVEWMAEGKPRNWKYMNC